MFRFFHQSFIPQDTFKIVTVKKCFRFPLSFSTIHRWKKGPNSASFWALLISAIFELSQKSSFVALSGGFSVGWAKAGIAILRYPKIWKNAHISAFSGPRPKPFALGYEDHLGKGSQQCLFDQDTWESLFLLLPTLQKNRHLMIPMSN